VTGVEIMTAKAVPWLEEDLQITNKFVHKYKLVSILFVSLIFLGLYAASLYSYLLFHTLIEFFVVAVSFCIFIISWNTKQFQENNYLQFLGIIFLFVGGLELMHTLAYKGMGVFRGYGANLATQFWIALRYVESISLLIAPFLLDRRMKINRVILIYSLIFIFLTISIFGGLFPACFVEGTGLTPFKIGSEYAISLMLIGAIVGLFYKRPHFDKSVFRILVAAIILKIVSELAFTFYVSVYGFSNLIGHYFTLISFYLIYRAIIRTGLVRPYDLLFRNLKLSEEDLRKSRDELELRVMERTADLESRNKELERLNQKIRELSRKTLEMLESDRQAVAKELHDSIGASLAAIKFSLEGEANSIEQNSRSGVLSLGKIVSYLADTIKETRRISNGLRPLSLDDMGLLSTLEGYIRKVGDFYPGIGFTHQIEIAEEDIPDRLKIVLYRVIQEALNNVCKHSRACTACLALIKADNWVELKVEDNGCGFDLQKTVDRDEAFSGYGLRSMQERVEICGGTFQILSEEGKGTAVCVSLPL
jgi:signal transduction histidine kinase